MQLWIITEDEVLSNFKDIQESRPYDLEIDFNEYVAIMAKSGRYTFPDNRTVDWVCIRDHADVIEEIKKHLILEKLKREVEI